jgi:hypothetical protein
VPHPFTLLALSFEGSLEGSLEGLALSLRRVGFKGADFDLSFLMSSSIFPYCKGWFSKPLGRDGFSGATLLAGCRTLRL